MCCFFLYIICFLTGDNVSVLTARMLNLFFTVVIGADADAEDFDIFIIVVADAVYGAFDFGCTFCNGWPLCAFSDIVIAFTDLKTGKFDGDEGFWARIFDDAAERSDISMHEGLTRCVRICRLSWVPLIKYAVQRLQLYLPVWRLGAKYELGAGGRMLSCWIFVCRSLTVSSFNCDIEANAAAAASAVFICIDLASSLATGWQSEAWTDASICCTAGWDWSSFSSCTIGVTFRLIWKCIPNGGRYD